MPIECAHVRSGSDGGIGLKPSDRWVISLCRFHHAEQHRVGEATFSKQHALDMINLAREFARLSPHRIKLGMLSASLDQARALNADIGQLSGTSDSSAAGLSKARERQP